MIHKSVTQLVVSAVAIVIFGATPIISSAAEKTVIRAVQMLRHGSAMANNFESMVRHVNEDKQAPIEIKVIGGPEVLPPFEMGHAVKTGVVDMALVTGAYYSNLLPGATALKLSEYTPEELRKNGNLDALQKIWGQYVNAHILGFNVYHVPFHLYLRKALEHGIDLTGYKLRTTAIYRAFFKDLGATTVETTPGELYTALQRGVVDGYGWGLRGLTDLGWQEQTRYRVDPGFYHSDQTVLINLDLWKKLTPQQREYLTQAGEWMEAHDTQTAGPLAVEAKEKQAKAGIKTIELTGAERSEYLQRAKDAGWAEVLKQAPTYGATLKKLLTK